MSFREFVAFIAALMAINALAIDIMLPALPAMADALGITVENQRQYIIAGYMFGFGVGAAGLWAAGRSLRPAAGPDRRNAQLRRHERGGVAGDRFRR
jgi:MFS family permease